MSANPLAPAWLQAPADANALPEAVWSRGARRSSDGALEVAGVPAAELAQRFGTPLYVVDEADARGRARDIRTAFERESARVGGSASVYYAGKAFLSVAVARWVIEEGLRIDVCSGGELAVALAAGVDPALLGFHGNNKSEAELDRAVRAGVGTIVVDSELEIERVARAAAAHGARQRVRLRINSGVHASTHEYLATAREDQKFGIPLADAERVVAVIRAHEELEFVGLHSHIGSQIFEAEGFAEAARRLFEVHARLLAHGPVPELNLGGGFGIAYTSADSPLDIDALAARFADIVAEGAQRHGVPVPHLAVEPGRSVIGPSTTTLYTVGTTKPVEVSLTDGGMAYGPGDLSTPTVAERSPVAEPAPVADPVDVPDAATRLYVSVDGGMSDNLRPALYGAEYSVRLANRSSEEDPALVRVVGKHCESGDIVVNADYLPGDVRPGDLLAVPATGAYCWSLSNNYNYLARPAVVAVRDGAARVIVRRETEEDLLSRDADLGRTS